MDIVYVIVAAFITALGLYWANGLFQMPRISPLPKTKELKLFIEALEKKHADTKIKSN